jgi:hypothetical protein
MFNHLDLLCLQQEPDGSFEFGGVVTPSGWHRYQYMLPKRGSLPELLEPVFRQAEAQGGTAVLDSALHVTDRHEHSPITGCFTGLNLPFSR